MKFSVFLFLLLFMLTTSDPIARVLQVGHGENARDIQYNPQSRLNHKKGYVLFVRDHNYSITDNNISRHIIFWIGTQLMRSKKLEVVHHTALMIYEYVQFPITNVHITRETSKSEIEYFKDLMSANVPVPKTIPRLYKVSDAYNICQIPLICEVVNDEDSFILDIGFVVTIYHSPLASNRERRIADLLAEYILNVKDYRNDNLGYISYLGDKENPSTAFSTFCDKILNSEKHYNKSKENYSPNNSAGNSGDANEIATNADNKYFEHSKENVLNFLKKHMLLTQIDTLHRDRILSFATASTFTVTANTDSGKKSKAAKEKIKLKATKRISFFESVFERKSKYVATTSKAAVSGNNKYENIIPIFLGSEECAPKTPFLIDTLKSKCVYILKDLENNELFIYLGKNVDVYYYIMALMAAEIDIDENPFVTLTIILEAQRIPTSFMIHIENEIKGLINK